MESLRWLRAVRARRYDLIVDLQCTDRSRILISCLWLLGAQAPWRLGNVRRFPYNVAPPPAPEPVHALTRINRALNSAGIEPIAARPYLFVPDADRVAAAQKLSALGLEQRSYVVFLPGSQSAGYLKRWGAERYACLAGLLAERGPREVLILGGPDEVNECAALAEGVASRGQARAHNLCGQTSLLELVPLCAGARLIVANDTGTAHVASAADRPMLVLCGPTDPRKVLPAGPQVRALQAKLPCVNCYRKHCEHHSCMALMSPQRVMETLLADAFFASVLNTA
jgi:heptosyltransferase-2